MISSPTNTSQKNGTNIAASILSTGKWVRGNRLAIVTNGGGPGVLATDRAEVLGVEITTLDAGTIETLDKTLPPHWSHSNPYQTRHNYASQLLSGGETPLFVAQQMGHKTTEMIMRHYGRWVEQAEDKHQHVFVSGFGQPGVSSRKTLSS